MRTKIFCLSLALGFGSAVFAQDVPKGEWFFGYNYVRVNSTTDVPAFSSNGGSSQVAINFSKYVSGVIDLGAYHNGVIAGYSVNNTIFNYLFGPRVNIRNHTRVTPYLNILFGGVYATAQATTQGQICTGTTCLPSALHLTNSQNAFAMAVGGGMDVRLGKHVSFRPIGLDYFLTRLYNPVNANDHNQNNIRYSAGLSFLFGGERAAPPPPPPPAMKTCPDGTSIPAAQECPKRNMNLSLSAARSESCPGATIAITPSGNVPDGATYEWTLNDQALSQGRTFDFGTSGRDPGAYRINLKVTAAGFNDATASTSVTVLPYRPPSGTVQVMPSEIPAGSTATVNANFTPGQCGGSMRGPVITASDGSIRGNTFDSAGIQFDPSNNSAQQKTVRITAQVADDRGPTSAEGTVVIKKGAAVQATRLPDIIFPAGSSRVNNCGKRVLLEDLKALMDRDPTGKVVFVGHVAEKEKAASLDLKRALNASAVISAGQGVCARFPASQIMVGTAGSAENGSDYQPRFCGTSATPKVGELPGQSVREADAQAKFRRVEVWWVPTGGVMPASASGSKDAVSLSVSSLGCPK
ncbi:MAG TPA: hypothetical protein VMH28_27605 [Candidatus Acidoferrales bacterium]|nr:hypothetical protein [Candidatus Acidoferrales bacterium]